MDDAVRSASLLVSAFVLACGVPPLGTATTDEDGSTSSGSESSQTETGELETATTESGTFIPLNDTFGSFVCDAWQQDCPEGEKCVPYGTGGIWDASKCVPILGEQAPGEPCTYDGVIAATDNCDGTSHCWDVMEIDGQSVGTCALFCTGTAENPECPAQHACVGNLINLCVKSCDPVLQDCDPDLGCFWTGHDFNCFVTTKDIPLGQPCNYINDCAEGLACLWADLLPACEGPECCSSFCDLNLGDGPCDALLPGTACLPFFEEGMAPAGYEHVGVCIVPP
jgi:hypothetical protein